MSLPVMKQKNCKAKFNVCSEPQGYCQRWSSWDSNPWSAYQASELPTRPSNRYNIMRLYHFSIVVMSCYSSLQRCHFAVQTVSFHTVSRVTLTLSFWIVIWTLNLIDC